MTELETSFRELQMASFPDHPNSDDLSNWLLELSEVDSYIAGLATRVIAGENPRSISVASINSLEKALQVITVSEPSDLKILDDSREYFKKVRAVHEALIKVECRENVQ